MAIEFNDYLALLQDCLQRRSDIVALVDVQLNCQKKPLEQQQDAALQARLLRDNLFAGSRSADLYRSALDQLERLRAERGFRPRANPGNDIVDPVQMLLRALHLWRQTRWPGQKGRQRYAHTLYHLFVLRTLALATLRLWDTEPAAAAARLALLQQLLDQLWQQAPADQPRLLQDVRWLIPVALSPTTDALDAYFTVAGHIAETFTPADRLETQRAWVQTGAGHLCAQLRHLCVQRGVGLDDADLVLLTRRSNALDVALLLEGLVSLLEAYAQAVQQNDQARRRTLAVAICHGLAPDPELFVNRCELLGPYSMIETVFITQDADGGARYTPAGERHLQLIDAWRDLIGQHAADLLQDCAQQRPPECGYSPYGALYGFSSNLLELIAFKTLQLDADIRFGMEQVFEPSDAVRRAWINAWRHLPHVAPDVTRQFEYPQDFVAAVAQRVEQALQRRVAGLRPAASGRLCIVQEAGPAAAADPVLPDVGWLPPAYVLSQEPARLHAQQTTVMAAGDFMHCRMEGEFLVSWQGAQGWLALGKDLLSTVLGEGRDIKVAGLPPTAVATLQLMAPDLVVAIG